MAGSKAEFLVNGVLNSQRMLRTKEYQLSKNRLFVEDKWLVSYLYQSGLSKETAFRYWSEIYRKRWGDSFDDMELDHRFSEWWGKTIPFFEGYPIVIYWEEIMAINDAKLLPWERQFVLMLLGYFKFMGWVKQKIDFIPIGKIMKWTNCGRRREAEDMKMFSDPESAGILTVNKTNAMVTFTCMKHEGHVAATLHTSIDLPVLLGLLRHEKKCSRCGRVFPASGDSKTDLCPACWKAYRKEKRAAKCQSKIEQEPVIPDDWLDK